MDGVNDDLHKLVTHICKVLHPSCILAGLLQMHQPLHPLALANDFQVWDLSTSVKIVCKCTPCFIGFRPHIISKPTLYLMCLKLAGSFDSYMLFDLIYRTKLWHFLKMFVGGLVEFWTTWCFSCHTFIRFPIGTCMPPNLHKCKLKKTQGHSSQFQR